MSESESLEREAIALYQSIPKVFRNEQMRGFLRRMADHLGWKNLKGVL